jgi:hypothetical protein
VILLGETRGPVFVQPTRWPAPPLSERTLLLYVKAYVRLFLD